MTGWLGVDSVTSCCCCELCQPVRCVIDQHEVEIVPATYRSTSSSLAPTTHRTHWSTSSSNTLQSSRTLISEGSIPRRHTRQLRLGEPAAYCTGTVDSHSVVKTTRRHSSHGQPQGANRTGSHNRHMSAHGAETPHQQRQQQSTPHGSLKTIDQECQECSRSHRLPTAGKKLRPRKSSRAEEKEKERRVKAEAGKCSPVPSHRGSSRATCSDQPFHLFEQDPQHDASFPEHYRAIQPEGKERSVFVGAAFASSATRTPGNASGGAVDVLPVAGDCPDHSRQCDADVPSYVSVACNRISCSEEDNGSVCRHPATNFPASRVFRALQVPHLVLNEQHLSRQLLVYAGGQQQQRTSDSSSWASSHSAGSVRAASPQNENSIHCNTPVRNDKENSAGVSTGRGVESSCGCPAAARQGVTKDEDGSRQSGDTAEGDAAAVSADLSATVEKNHACGHVTGIPVTQNLSCAYKGSTTPALDTAEGGRGTGKRIRAWQSKRPSRVLESSTGTGETSSVEMVCGSVSRGRVPFCSSWTEWGKGAATVQAASSCKATSYFPHDKQTGGIADGSRTAYASASGGAVATTCSGSSHSVVQEKDSRTREPPPRRYYPWFTKFPPDCGIFFYDSSIGCADGLGTTAVEAAGEWVATDDESFVTAAEPGNAVQIDTQNVGTFCSKERTSCVARNRPQLQPQANAPTQMQHAGLTEVARTTRGTANLRERSQQSSFGSRAHCPPRPAFDEAQGEQQPEQDPSLGRTAAAPDGVTVGVISHAHRYRKRDCQQRRKPHQADQAVNVLLANEHQRARREQQRQEGNETFTERRRSRETPGKMHLLFHSDEVEEETGDANPQKRCQSAKQFVVSNVAQHNADAASALLPLGNISPIRRTDKRTEEVCLSPAHLQGRPLCQRRFEDDSRDGRSPVAADYKCTSHTYDIWRLRRNHKVIAGDDTILEECMNAESRGSSNSSATASLHCLSPSSVSVQGKATAAQLRTEVVGSGVCYELTSTLCSLVASLTTSALPEEASQQPSAQQQQEHSLYTAWQQRDRLAQQRGNGAVKSSDDSDGCTPSAQSADAASLYTLPAKTEETTGTRLLLLPSSFSAQVSSLRTRRGSSLACKCRVQHTTGQADPHCNNKTHYIGSKRSVTSYRNRCVCLRSISSTDSVGGDRSCSSWNAVGVTTFNRRSECQRDSGGGRSIYNVSASAESSAGDLQSTANARQSSSLKNNGSGATRRSVEAQLTSGCNTGNLTSHQSGDTAAAAPLSPNALLRRCCERKQPSKKSFGSSALEELVSTPSHKSGSTHQSLSATNHCFEDRMPEPVSPAVTPGLIASQTVADVARKLNRHSCVSSRDRDTLLPLEQRKAQEPREKEGQEKEQCKDEDSQTPLRGKRLLRSKVKCSENEMGQGLLSKGARLVLWQAKTNQSSPVAPAHLMVS